MSLLSFPRGLVELVEALERDLAGRIRLDAPVERIERIEGGWSVICCGDGRADTSAFADHVALCVPAPVAASLLAPAIGEFVDLSFLRNIQHASVTVVHLGFAAGFAEGVELPPGFGYLVPPDADDRGDVSPRALGTIFTSNLFGGRTPPGGASVASFYRGSDVAALDAAGLIDLAVNDLRLALGNHGRTIMNATIMNGRRMNGRMQTDGLPRLARPQCSYIRRWSHVIPRYAPEHDRQMAALLDTLKDLQLGLHLGGAFTGGVSVGQVIARGRAIAREVLFQEQYA